ncbi:MAG TPA: cation:proton antiporter [Kiritimatiellae bacterium]|nr:cation:proton antiporter [Kiritimatiellia bacterium]
MRYSVSGLAVGVGGIVAAFAIGDVAAVLLGIADSFLSPSALFLGTVATATSVGLTARLLSERKKMGSPEGVTILAAAVFDDVLGIVVLALVVAVSRAQGTQTAAEWSHIVSIGAKAMGFWIFFTAAGLLLARRLTQLLKKLHSMTTIASVCVGLALLVAGLSEMAGLAMIIGAYIVGLSLAQTDIAYELQERLRSLYDFLIPIFFCVMGMLVDFSAVKGVWLGAMVFGLAGIAAKILGCGIPAWFTGFNLRGAIRVGAGMISRAEVALIVAGIGLSSNIISPEVFGIAVSLTMLSTLVAPPLIVWAFQGGSGLRVAVREKPEEEIQSVTLELPSAELAEFLVSRINRAFRAEEYFVHRLHTDTPTWQIRKEDISFTIIQDDRRVILNMPVRYQHIARFIVLEEILNLSEFLESVRKMQSPQDMGTELLKGAFD